MLKTLAQRKGQPKLCLTMIVRNEQDNMRRLLDSLVRPGGGCIVDMVCISDNGPAEEVECEAVTRAWCEEHSMPLAYFRVPWVNFAVNRTQNMQQARETFPDATYFLLSDADFVWDLDHDGKRFDTRLLYADKYLVRQTNATQDYWNVRLLSRRCEWECRGATHEYWAPCDKDEALCKSENLNSLHIDDRDDGGFKQTKFVRDYKLLLDEINDPSTRPVTRTRDHFYLAQTCWSMGNYEESIKWYAARLELGGWHEEIYYSAFRVGKCNEALGFQMLDCERLLNNDPAALNEWQKGYMAKHNPDRLPADALRSKREKYLAEARHWYRKATTLAPARGEALYSLVRLLRVFGEHEEALRLAQVGVRLTQPKGYILFVDRWLYPHGFEMEVAYNAGLLGQLDVGFDYAVKLNQNQSEYPEWVLADLKNIMPLYV